MKMASMLHAFKDHMEFKFLDNKSRLGFITGDQPIVNLFIANDISPPVSFVAYYPLSPKLALLMYFKEYGIKPITLDEDTIRKFNDAIAFQSENVLVSNANSALHSIRDAPPSTPPSFHHLFENLTYNPADDPELQQAPAPRTVESAPSEKPT